MEFQASNYIVALTNLPLAVCKQCQHAIWPREVRRHYYGKEYRLPKKIVDQIEVAIQGWDGLYQGLSQLEASTPVSRPIALLKLRRDGLLCRGEPINCQFVCCNEKMIRKHLGQAYNMSLYGRKGRPIKRQQERRAQLKEGPQPWILVAYQRFFPSCQGSQYFQVLQPDEVRPPTADRIVPRWDLAVKAMEEKVKEVKAEQQRKIVAGGDREVNQWLERAGWDKYLADVDVDQLLDCVAAPDEETERQLWMIWHRIDGMV